MLTYLDSGTFILIDMFSEQIRNSECIKTRRKKDGATTKKHANITEIIETQRD
jgi:hypothetical protein